jgi:hypothetical protein
MGATARYGLAYIDRGEPMRNTRADLQANAETTEAALLRIAGYVDQLVTVLPGSATYIGTDTDGAPYYDPSGAATQPAAVGLDTDGVPYLVSFTDRSTL